MSNSKDVDEAEQDPVDAMKSVFLLNMLCAFYKNAIKAGANENAARGKLFPALQMAKTFASFNEILMSKMDYLLSIDKSPVIAPKECILDRAKTAL